jgi:hypothetical protein
MRAIIFILILAVPGTPCGAEDEPKDHFLEAKRFYDLGDFDHCIREVLIVRKAESSREDAKELESSCKEGKQLVARQNREPAQATHSPGGPK